MKAGAWKLLRAGCWASRAKGKGRQSAVRPGSDVTGTFDQSRGGSQMQLEFARGTEPVGGGREGGTNRSRRPDEDSRGFKAYRGE